MNTIEGAILLLGATSEIGCELTRRLCSGREVVLAARRTPDPKPFYEAGASKVHILFFEATQFDHHRLVFRQAQQLAGPITTVIISFGMLGDQELAEYDEDHAVEIATVDYTAQLSMLTVVADELQETPQHQATIVSFSSIAGWRARRANYVYGSTKAGLDAFCQGLSDSLHNTNVSLITARPGFVIGRMTAGMTPAPMSVTASQVAETLAPIIDQTTTSRTVWIPARLHLLAWVMRLVPRRLWRRMPR